MELWKEVFVEARKEIGSPTAKANYAVSDFDNKFKDEIKEAREGNGTSDNEPRKGSE